MSGHALRVGVYNDWGVGCNRGAEVAPGAPGQHQPPVGGAGSTNPLWEGRGGEREWQMINIPSSDCLAGPACAFPFQYCGGALPIQPNSTQEAHAVQKEGPCTTVGAFRHHTQATVNEPEPFATSFTRPTAPKPAVCWAPEGRAVAWH
uniref:Uncharacterized protein n=1 Tax=Eutreptiella gymnastica TaxID=73025 RepID=A0A7S4D3X2_9EUGL